MEASENAGVSRVGGGPDIRRIDLDRVTQTMRGAGSQRGYARLMLMLDTVFPRLTDGAAGGRRD